MSIDIATKMYQFLERQYELAEKVPVLLSGDKWTFLESYSRGLHFVFSGGETPYDDWRMFALSLLVRTRLKYHGRACSVVLLHDRDEIDFVLRLMALELDLDYRLLRGCMNRDDWIRVAIYTNEFAETCHVEDFRNGGLSRIYFTASKFREHCRLVDLIILEDLRSLPRNEASPSEQEVFLRGLSVEFNCPVVVGLMSVPKPCDSNFQEQSVGYITEMPEISPHARSIVRLLRTGDKPMDVIPVFLKRPFEVVR